MTEKQILSTNTQHCQYVVHSDTRAATSLRKASHSPTSISFSSMCLALLGAFAAREISSQMSRIRHILRIRARIQDTLVLCSVICKMRCLLERAVRRVLGSASWLIFISRTLQRISTAKLVHSLHAPCVRLCRQTIQFGEAKTV